MIRVLDSAVIGSLTPIRIIDIVIILGVPILANIVFNPFEKHLPIMRRITKHASLVILIVALGLLFGRIVFYSVLGLLAIGQVILHAWYFPRHGVNGLTAEPYETYLRLISKMKNE